MDDIKNNKTDNPVRIAVIKKNYFTVILLVLTFSDIFSQPEKLYSKSEIVEDIDFLARDIEAIHPNLYHSISKEVFYEKVKTIKNEIPDSMSKIDTWRKINMILPLIKEGHTYIRPPARSIGNFQRFPFNIKIDNNIENFIISGSLIDSLKKYTGEKIVSINGISTDSLITIFHNNTSAENDALFVFMNEKHIDYALYLIFGSPKFFDVTLFTADKKINLRCKSIEHIPDKFVSDFTFDIIDKNIGLIDMN
ncbi:MAG: hypothetical protein J7K64_00180, partial [Bacteroidales bacterium]|nr:hypothetical protein [Bacteroidales bacterium]